MAVSIFHIKQSQDNGMFSSRCMRLNTQSGKLVDVNRVVVDCEGLMLQSENIHGTSNSAQQLTLTYSLIVDVLHNHFLLNVVVT